MNIINNYDFLISTNVIYADTYVKIDKYQKGEYTVYYAFKKELKN